MKLVKVILIGSLLLGGIASIEVIAPTKQVKAAYSDPFNDDWGYKTVNELEKTENSTYQSDWNIEHLITGDTFYLTQRFGREHFGAKMKIFKIHHDGSLQRFITIEPEFITTPKGLEIWRTPITHVYTQGTYIAVIKYNAEFTYSNHFQIN
ncbi:MULTISPECIES: DUF5065 family protein [Bacillus cereus group]|uniref:DUF5065 family protein n=1 Tax=Bacillus cereus group TaxID=86661 RepID=UPI0006A91993|nr:MULTISPECIES: DUF5065 family protein [Bacillus cereus group]OPD59639.1 DUF5065 domain-containing protein [Bacillus anthracis]CUB27395.1 hypothetical protein BN2127_JRS4_00019 [Bacillus cereus]